MDILEKERIRRLHREHLQTDCYFHESGNSMGVLYDHCNYIQGIEYDECPCYQCGYYISREDARDIIIRFIESRKGYREGEA